MGEDGPTHEPIEQLASVRCIPNVHVIRPADGNETVAAWRIAMTSTETPTILVLSRQNLPVLEGTLEHASDSVQKVLVLSPQKVNNQQGILIATGSEVNLAVEAQAKLAEEASMYLSCQCQVLIYLKNNLLNIKKVCYLKL